MKKRLIFGLMMGTAVFGAVFASAASLGGLNSGRLGADDSAVVACDTDGVEATYTTAYNTTGSAGYKVKDIKLSGINNACDGADVQVTLTGTSGASLKEVTGVLASDAAVTNQTLDGGSTALAESVLGIHVVINGAPVTTP